MDKQKKPTIYTVATAHLDTVWNWDFERTVREYIPATLDDNFELFEKYPDYVFSFEGAYRYELMEEYYPEKFEKLKKYVADGRWFVTGSAYENGDVNVPSPEALFRNILYGNRYFQEKFGKTSVDIYLPDCFGFGYALPSIIKHAGLLGFTTQKLTWSSAYGIPFDLGLWQGVDGSRVYASLDAQDYSATLSSVREHKNAPNKLQSNIEKYDLPMTYLLHGTGDRGGAPKEKSVRTVVREKKKNAESKTDVEIVSVDKVFRIMDADLTDAQKEKLPVWNNELVSTAHGVGGYTSRALGKRWNKQNEQLADAAERFSAAAAYLGAQDYPKTELDTAWKRVIAHQFHDDLPGTSVERAYKRSWNDYALSLNQLSWLYETAASKVVGQMTVPFTDGVAVAVTNPTQFERTEAVRCILPAFENVQYVRVENAAGEAVPSQISDGEIWFSATVPANGAAVYCITAAAKPYAGENPLVCTQQSLENQKYKVLLDDNGDICSIFDKTLGKELLSAPIQMALHKYNGSHNWPAWELDYPEVMAEPQAYASNPRFLVAECGAARVCIETERTEGDSVFRQRISLGYGETVVRVENQIDWRSPRTLLKTPFTFTVQNENAAYDLGLGFIRRGLNTEKLYEVPAQNWADISGEKFGVSVLSDCKYGWDHPTADTIRLTGIHTPRADFRKDSQQSCMDLGRNQYAFAVFSHEGGDLTATQAAGICFNQPLRAFRVPLGQKGILPSAYSFASVSDPAVLVRAVKQSEDGTHLVIRVNEGAGTAHKKVELQVGDGIKAAWVCNASEEVLEKAVVKKGVLVFDIAPFAPMTFRLELKKASAQAEKTVGTPVRMPYNCQATSENKNRKNGIFKGYTLPSEQFPSEVHCKNTVFTLSGARENAVCCGGQTLHLPQGTKRVALLLTSLKGDKTVPFRSGTQIRTAFVPDFHEALGAGDLYASGETGYLKRCALAKEFTHLHSAAGDEIAVQTYLFYVEVPVADNTLVLPTDSDIVVFAATALKESAVGGALAPLCDRLEKEPSDYRRPARESRLSRLDGLITALEKSKLFGEAAKKL